MMKTRLRVKEIAKEKNMSMTRLHIESEVPYSTIRNIFKNPFQGVTTYTLAKLAGALGVETRDLLEDVPDEADEPAE
ncbi:helix-turn-helix domain-containing protein [Thermosporothrix hazakensis]|nr:helix-turn-helix transcriptional regulator [Thermosporothrix hazakensis]